MNIMKIETKFYVEGKEVELIANNYGTKIYKSGNEYFITNYDDVIAYCTTDTMNIPQNETY